MPTSMYVYPVNPDAKLPEAWQKNAKPAVTTIGENLDIQANRDSWLADFNWVFDVAP